MVQSLSGKHSKDKPAQCNPNMKYAERKQSHRLVPEYSLDSTTDKALHLLHSRPVVLLPVEALVSPISTDQEGKLGLEQIGVFKYGRKDKSGADRCLQLDGLNLD
ncbi:hypothetical protein HAX54_000807 [Datura stramonium]|uniref:Uncharacterized protein n=1 Tax=Datura stramonium TaxID=4076 RepID=A0ABS8T264_DATST|nr:hypothetical protein [Datura stramonium]